MGAPSHHYHTRPALRTHGNNTLASRADTATAVAVAVAVSALGLGLAPQFLDFSRDLRISLGPAPRDSSWF